MSRPAVDPTVEEYERDGVWVTHARPAGGSGARPPLVFVHVLLHDGTWQTVAHRVDAWLTATV